MKELAFEAVQHLERAKTELIQALQLIDRLTGVFIHIADVCKGFEPDKEEEGK